MAQGSIRIIGGAWRGRKLLVPDLTGLRPTPNRVRETLFNWLMPHIAGARCLDLFAGSGALGFEAASRGALSVTMVDVSAVVVDLLLAEKKILQADQVEIYTAKIPEQLRKPTSLFDVVFLDPPYQANLLFESCYYLEKNNYLAPEALIYLESSAALTATDLPENWRIIKNQRAGDVCYHLALRE